MVRKLCVFAAVAVGLVAVATANRALAQKQGGILKSYSIDSPASMSIHEEVTIYAVRPMMGVFNNLVMYDQHVKQNSMQSIVPDLAIGWTWDEDGKQLTFKLHEGVKWHDGKPFKASDVKCAPGTCCRARRARRFGSTRARRGIATSTRSPPTAITR